jgi:acyl-coenzyme A thioesterase PaaI-like protein
MARSPEPDADPLSASPSLYPGADAPSTVEAAELADLVSALRRVRDAVTGVDAPSPVVRQATGLLQEAADALEPYRMHARDVDPWEDLRRTLHTRSLNPPFHDTEADRDHLRATITFTAFYAGGNGAAHGGAIPLLFDEVLGRLANTDRSMSRTAYLNVDFRRVTPIDVPLRVEGRFEREEGRKRFLYGAIYDGEHLTAEAHGLFVALRDGAA